jgi:hypothetical protein
MEIKSILGEKVLIEWRKMESLQPDNLKMPYNIGHLKKSLLENNFAMPFFGWQNGESVFVIDGHQRREVLSELESEGVKVPELLDCQLINAKDRQEAVKLLLSVFNSKSNPIDLEVLTEWVEMEQVEVEITSLNVIHVGETAPDIDYSILDDDDLEDQLKEMTDGVKKAIQIEFEAEHYEEASELVKFWREQKLYIGGFLMEKLKAEKEKINA